MVYLLAPGTSLCWVNVICFSKILHVFMGKLLINCLSPTPFHLSPKSDKGVGFAAVFPNQIIKRRLPYDASIFTAELMAILTSRKRILVRRGSSFVIASDSQSAILP